MSISEGFFSPSFSPPFLDPPPHVVACRSPPGLYYLLAMDGHATCVSPPGWSEWERETSFTTRWPLRPMGCTRVVFLRSRPLTEVCF